jgi:hypothetical protein
MAASTSSSCGRLARLGYKDYVSVESVFQMEKRTPEDKVRVG